MTEQNEETRTTSTFQESDSGRIHRTLSLVDFLSTKERESLFTRDIFREIDEPYVPLDESHIRIIDIQRSIGRGTYWERITANILTELNKKLSSLEKQMTELATAVQNTSKICNATIYELNSSKYNLSMPVQIVLEEDQQETVARIPELNLYASGDTDSEAINELKEEVVNLYEELLSSDKTLGPLPKSWLYTLKRLLVKKSGHD